MIDNDLFRPMPVITASALALVLSACGGGGGGGGSASTPASPAPSSSTGGDGASTPDATQRTVSGSITGFGSVFVGGVRFETDNAEIIVNGEPASERDLAVGMMVTLNGTVDGDGTGGTAVRIVYDDQLTGPIERIEADADGDALLLVVLGFSVIVERTGTVFDNVTYDTLATGDVVEVSGFPQDGNRLRASRIERRGGFASGSTVVELNGIARNVTADSFSLGSVTVDTGNAFIDEDDGPLIDGARVEVYGTLADGVLTATEVDTEDGPAGGLNDGDSVTVESAISGYVDDSNFRVRGLPVDASGAVRAPADLVLASGAVVRVTGTWDGERVIAESIGSRRGRIEVEGPVGAVDTATGSVELALAAGTITVTTDQGTRLSDDRDDIDRFTLADIVPGDFLEIEAYLAGDRLVATVIDREDTDDEIVQGPVESFNAGSDITLLGVTFSVGDTDYEDLQDRDISAETFFANLQVGDLVKLQDDELADGVVDDIEFEDRDRLDGEREFGCGYDDDGTSCDDDDLIGDDSTTDDDDIDTTEDDDTDEDGIDTSDDDEGDDDTDEDGIDTSDDDEDDDDTDEDGIDTPDDEDDDTDGDGVDTSDDDDAG